MSKRTCSWNAAAPTRTSLPVLNHIYLPPARARICLDGNDACSRCRWLPCEILTCVHSVETGPVTTFFLFKASNCLFGYLPACLALIHLVSLVPTVNQSPSDSSHLTCSSLSFSSSPLLLFIAPLSHFRLRTYLLHDSFPSKTVCISFTIRYSLHLLLLRFDF